MLFELLTGTAPFQAPTQAAMFEKILKVRVTFPKNFPPLAKDLISRLLRAVPDERLSLNETINHPWMQTHQPIRPTITQNVIREALPCLLDSAEEPTEVAIEDPIKPFQETEYRVLSKPNQREEEKKVEPVVSAQLPNTSSPSKQLTKQPTTANNLDIELKQTRDENKKYQAAIDDKEAELRSIGSRMQELESTVARLESEYEEKKKTEKELKDQLADKSSRNAELIELQASENQLYNEYEGLRTKCFEKETELNLLKTEIETLEKSAKENTHQTEGLERDINRVRAEVDQVKQKHNRTKAEIQEQFNKLTSELEDLKRTVNSKDRDSSVVSLEALLSFTQENLIILKNRAKVENELLKQYQDANEKLVELDNRYAEMRLTYENYMNELQKNTESREMEFSNIKPADISSQSELEAVKERLRDCLGKQHSNKLITDELIHLQSMVNQYEKSLGLAKKQHSDLEYLRHANQKKINYKK